MNENEVGVFSRLLRKAFEDEDMLDHWDRTLAEEAGKDYDKMHADQYESFFKLIKFCETHGDQVLKLLRSSEDWRRIKIRPYPKHPGAICPGPTGAFQLNSGDRFIYDINGRRGWVDEFTQDGDAYVCWDDGTYDIIKWNLMSPETK